VTISEDRTRAFYTVANAGHFIGAVALINSLRLLGHSEPIRLVDAGLDPSQRRRLEPHVELVPAPAGVAPVHLAPYGPQLMPAEVQIILDADLIATRRLDDLFDSGAAGRTVGFVNDPPNHERWFAEWSSVLSLGQVAKRPYLNAGQLVLPEVMNDRILTPWIAGQDALGLGDTRYGRARITEPFYFADQDVLNAVLGAHLQEEEIEIRPHELAPHPPFLGLKLRDMGGSESGVPLCAYPDGRTPYFLHHTMDKPWLRATPINVYSLLLPRLLLAEDVALRLSAREVPLRLRADRLGRWDRRRAHLVSTLRRTARRRLGVLGVRTRWEDRRRRSAR